MENMSMLKLGLTLHAENRHTSRMSRFISLLILLCLFCAGCGREETTFVCAGIPPVAWLTQTIAGPGICVVTLLPPGQNPHTYEPTVRQAASLANARLLVTVGLPMEDTLAKSTRANVINLAPGAHEHEHDDDDGCDHNPHIWLSPRRLIPLLPSIAEGLAAAFPGQAEDFRARAKELAQTLTALDAELTAQFAPFAGKTFFDTHPAWALFAEDYGLRELALEKDGKEITAKHLADFISELKTHSARVVFCDPFSNRAPLKSLNVEIQLLDPLPADLPAGLREAAREICEALGAPGASPANGVLK